MCSALSIVEISFSIYFNLQFNCTYALCMLIYFACLIVVTIHRCDAQSQAATFAFDVTILNLNNLSDELFRSLYSNSQPWNVCNQSNQEFQFDHTFSNLILRLNILPLQAHFDELNEFLLQFSVPLSIILLSKTNYKDQLRFYASFLSFSSPPLY